MSDVQAVTLHDAARERYLSYALSVITSRALPDVRDGLKPVQRRILYAMHQELSLHAGGRYRKCATVVGEVMGKYHPHGDQSIYDALVRMAQPFSLRNPLVDGQGNFGSLDGDPPAAMRYTECRLRPLADELLREIGKDTVDFRSNFDGQRDEPVVLPAQFPQLLVNGVEGIAVGLATRIPPHNLGEVVDACVALLDGTATDVDGLMQHVRGPDFPTGGRIVSEAAALRDVYTTGQGTLRVQGTWTTEKDGRRELVVVTSIPYGANKAKLVERIGEDVVEKRLPLVVDVRDESTEQVRIVLELKAGASPDQVMAWLYKRTGLETTFPCQMNALVPAPDGGLPRPEKLDLLTMLQTWVDFRLATVRRRCRHELAELEGRIHILEGFFLIFLDLDEVIALIRASRDKKDAARRLIDRFKLSEAQTEAILELKLYKLASLEIALVQEELDDKRGKAADLREILGSETKLTARVRAELVELRALYADPRRTEIGAAAAPVSFDETAYIVREDAFVVVSRDGWIKRQTSFTGVDKIRVREGDEVGWLVQTDTLQSVTFLGSDGSAYTLRADAIPATAGHGKPLTSIFAMPDGARVVGVVGHDPRRLAGLVPNPKPEPDDPPGPFVVAVTRLGRVIRLAASAFAEPSNRNGRLFARLEEGDSVVAARVAGGGEILLLATHDTHVLAFPVRDAHALKAAGKGVTAIKLDDDEVVLFELATAPSVGPEITLSTGRAFVVSLATSEGPRAGKGRQLLKRGTVERVPRGVTVLVDPARPADGGAR